MKESSSAARVSPPVSTPANISYGIPEWIPQDHKSQVDAPFGYFGSKQKLAARIASMLPPHNAWVEAFCGSAAVTLAKPPAQIEIINDLDGQIVNFFTQLREQPEDLYRNVDLTPYARQEFEEARHADTSQPALEQARRFLVRSMMTVNGNFGNNHGGFSYSQSFARGGVEARVSRWNALSHRLRQVQKRLRNVRVEHRDAIELVEMFVDRPATLVYLDPPYLTKRDHGYQLDANEEDFHKKLLKLCCRARCMILISGYANPLYSSMLTKERGWKLTRIETHTRDARGKDYARTEVLWKNDAFTKALREKKIPIRLTKAEKHDGKINPPRKR